MTEQVPGQQFWITIYIPIPSYAEQLFHYVGSSGFLDIHIPSSAPYVLYPLYMAYDNRSFLLGRRIINKVVLKDILKLGR